MQIIFFKRVLRKLISNFFKYFALSLTIILSMVLVVSIVSAADSIILGTSEMESECAVEDGQFVTFVPLLDEEIKTLESKNVEIEPMFYMDYKTDYDGLLRVFKERKNQNKVCITKGKSPSEKNEIVIEKRHSEENNIQIDDKIDIVGQEFVVSGIGVSPDYNAPYKNLSDPSIDSSSFGPAWVTDEGYNSLAETGKSKNAEEYLYSYKLGNNIDDDELKKLLESFEFNPEKVEDISFKEYWRYTNGKIDDFDSYSHTFDDGLKSLSKGLTEIKSNNDSINNSGNIILDYAINNANVVVRSIDSSIELNADNYAEKLEKCAVKADALGNGEMIRSLKRNIDELKANTDGLIKYTNSISDVESSALKLSDSYSKLLDNINDIIKEMKDKISVYNLKIFVASENNPRIGAAAKGQNTSKMGGLFAGVIIMILLGYVISVFITHEIEDDSSVIGTLYALGYKQKEILSHYLLMPAIITLLSGIIGLLIGLSNSAIGIQLKSVLSYFSFSNIDIKHPFYLVIYATVMPPLVAVFINLAVISSNLRKPALSLIRREVKQPKVSKIKLKRFGFINKFRIRQFIREFRSSIAVVIGMFFSLMLLMLGLDIYFMCDHIRYDNKNDVHFEYMYTYKYPDENIPDGSYEAFGKNLKMNNLGFSLDVCLLGIRDDEPYFDVNLSDNSSDVVISSAMSEKFSLDIGDSFIVKSDEKNQKYVFTVSDVTEYSPGFYLFMNIDVMREFFGSNDNYFNIVFSDKELDINPRKINSVTTKDDISKASEVYIDLMSGMIGMLIVVSIIVFVVVMYLMMKIILDRSSHSISLMQMLGYRTKEIRKLYLDGNFVLVSVGAALIIPVTKAIIDKVYPLMVANAACSINLKFPWHIYFLIYITIFILYFIINRMLVFRIRKVKPSDILNSKE